MPTAVEIPTATYWEAEPVLALVGELNRTPNSLQEILRGSSAFQFSIRAVTHGQGDFRSFGEPRLIRGGFGVDGEFGFLIQSPDPMYGDLNVAIVSFNLTPQNYGNLVEDEPDTYPRIVQLQACMPMEGASSGRNRRVSQVVGAFSLAQGEVRLAEHFARTLGYNKIGILPADLNPSRDHEGFSMDRARVRYDGTAEAMGYKRSGNTLYLKTF